ncbi:MAG TPA: hypothetical protein VGN12_26015 [Pirellulales bacterium]|jgi:hypothetical protein
MRQTEQAPRHPTPAITLSPRKKAAFALFVLSFFLVAGYSLWCVGWSWKVYRYLKDDRRGWRGTVHRADAELGYASIPGSEGEQTFAIGPDLPIRYDENGFRVPPAANASTPSADGLRILTLGCSFTFGDACPAEETFAFRLQKELQGTVLNAGKCSYGLAQMVLLARELIPRHKPDLVVVQYSPWLLDRSMTCYLPSYYGAMPGPYFCEREGKLEIARPVFAWSPQDFSHYRDTPKSFGEFLSFAARHAIPLKIHDDLGRSATSVKQRLGLTPVPCRDAEQVVAAGYSELEKLCQDAQAQMVVVVLGGSSEPVTVPAYLAELGVPLAHAHEAMIEQLTERDQENYLKTYANWRGEPPRMVDTHPNAQAHEIIANCIVDALRQADHARMANEQPATVR